MATDLKRAAYSGKETFLYYNSATHAAPEWVEISRARNVTTNDGPELSDVDFHGAQSTKQIPGYSAFNGSFEYVLAKNIDDTVFTALKEAKDDATIIEFMHLNGPSDSASSTGWKAPCLIGQFAATANGGDPVVTTIPFGLADAYDSADVALEVEPATGTAVVRTAPAKQKA